MPGLSEALKPQQGRQAVGQPAPPKAVAGPPPAPREEARPQAKQPASAKTAKAGDEDWWTE
jgi:hypothetical protein